MTHPSLQSYREEILRPIKTTAQSEWDLDHPEYNNPIPLEKYLEPLKQTKRTPTAEPVKVKSQRGRIMTGGILTRGTGTVTTLEDISEETSPETEGRRLGSPQDPPSRWEQFEKAEISPKDVFTLSSNLSEKKRGLLDTLSTDEKIKLGWEADKVKQAVAPTPRDKADYFKEYPDYELSGSRYIDKILRAEVEDLKAHQRTLERSRGGIKSRPEALREVARPGPETLVLRKVSQASSNKIEDELKKINENLWRRHTQHGLHYNQFTKQERRDYENASKRASRVPSKFEQSRRPVIKTKDWKDWSLGERFKTRKQDIPLLVKGDEEQTLADQRRFVVGLEERRKSAEQEKEFGSRVGLVKARHERPELAEFRTDLSREVKEQKKKEALDKRGILKFTGKIKPRYPVLSPSLTKDIKRTEEIEKRKAEGQRKYQQELETGEATRKIREGLAEAEEHLSEEDIAFIRGKRKAERRKRLKQAQKELRDITPTEDPQIEIMRGRRKWEKSMSKLDKWIYPEEHQKQQSKKPQPEPEPEPEPVQRTEDQIRHLEFEGDPISEEVRKQIERRPVGFAHREAWNKI